MTQEKFKRKLTAIFMADVKGYSRLMGEDDEGTLHILNAYRGVMTGFIENNQGRVVNIAGDSVLAEFGSVVDAVRGAVEIQKELKDRNKELPEGRRMDFRIGINLGDVLEESDTIYGDGVNIAARLESLATAGGICISGIVYDQIKSKLAFGYEYLGEQSVKNIAEPVRVYRVQMEPGAAVSQGAVKKKTQRRDWLRVALPLGVVLVVLFAAVAIWRLYWHPAPPPGEVLTKERVKLPLPDKPSIAILPFVNMSNDKEQEYFSDGLTEDLITDISKISGLFVIARNSTFVYKGKPVKIRQVAEELGVHYVLEGSVRKVGDSMRINAQLIDGLTEQHLWAERYDGKMDDVFSLQDKICHRIVSALALKLTAGEKELMALKGTANAEAYDAFLKGWEHLLRVRSDDLAQATQHFQRAIELDPNYGRAKAAMGLAYWQDAMFGKLVKGSGGYGGSWIEARLRSRQWLQEAIKQPSALAHRLNAYFYLARRQHEEAIAEIERALVLEPNDPLSLLFMGNVLNYMGKPQEAIDLASRAMRLDPQNPANYFMSIGMAKFNMGDYQEAATFAKKGLSLNPELVGVNAFLAATYGLLGLEREAKAALKVTKKWSKSLTLFPIGLREYMYAWPFRNRLITDRLAEGLLKAGLPGKLSGYLHGSKENQLTGKELRDLASGLKKLTGNIYLGLVWTIEVDKEGQITYRGPAPDGGLFPIVAHGKMRIEGDLICNQYQKYFYGLEYCQTVFKNVNGTYEGKNEYFTMADIGTGSYSPVR